jgi:outer membrane murein-binding lipoprotein Lpp
MKKVTSLIVFSFLLLTFFGCASRDYVRQQIEPLVDRISKLEARVSAIESRVGALEGKVAEIDQAKKDAAEAKSLAEEAMRTAKDCCEKAEAAVQRGKPLRPEPRKPQKGRRRLPRSPGKHLNCSKGNKA